MVTAKSVQWILCSPDAFLAFVMDVEAYAAVDDKLAKIEWVRREPTFTEFQFLGRLPGIPLPPTRTVSQMRLTPGKRIDIVLAPLPRNRLAHLTSQFSASFTCEMRDDGTEVVRTVSFDFALLLSPLIEPILRRTLPVSVERELRLAKDILEGRTGAAINSASQ